MRAAAVLFGLHGARAAGVAFVIESRFVETGAIGIAVLMVFAAQQPEKRVVLQLLCWYHFFIRAVNGIKRNIAGFFFAMVQHRAVVIRAELVVQVNVGTVRFGAPAMGIINNL